MGQSVSANRRMIGIAARMALALGLLALAIWTNRTKLAEVARHSIDLRYFVLALTLYVAGLVLSYARWLVLVRAVEIPIRFRDAVRLGFIGALFNFVIPGAVVGVFVRAAYLCREHPDKKPQAIASAVIDLLVGLLGLISLACAAGTLGWNALEHSTHRLVTLAWVVAGVLSTMLVIAFSPTLYRPLMHWAAPRQRLARFLGELIVTGTAYRKRIWVIVAGIALGAGTHLLNVIAFYVVGHALFSQVPSVADHLLIVPLVLFSTGVPLPFGALGVSEQVSGGLFRLASYTGGAVAMMGFRVLQIGGATIGLAVYMANLTQIRTLRREAESLAEETDFTAYSEVSGG
jgi:uncharacterized protein (TIRG00374 family)